MKYTAAALIGLALISSNATANKGDLWIDVTLASRHTNESGLWYDDDNQPHEWNENNLGLGVGYGVLPGIEAKAGFYKNSHNVNSVYGGFKWHTNYERFISIGLTVGLVTGYEIAGHIDTPVTPFILPAITIHPHHRVRVEFGFVPGAPGSEGEKTNVFTAVAGFRF